MFTGSVKSKVVRSNFRQIVQQGRRAAARRNKETAEDAVKIARQLVPVSDNNDPGHVHLRDTIRVEEDRRTGTASAVMGDESKGVLHGPPVEFGTVNMAAQPTMRPAAEQAARRARSRRIRVVG